MRYSFPCAAAASEDWSAPLSLLAVSIAGPGIRVLEKGVGLAFTDGERIFVPPGPRETQQLSVMAQASLLASGSLERSVVAPLVGSRDGMRRYLTLELARVTALGSWYLPLRLTAAVADVYAGPVPGSAQQSIAWARRRKVPLAPGWMGSVKPLRLIRNRRPRPLQLTTTPAQSNEPTTGTFVMQSQPPDAVDDQSRTDSQDDESEHSRLLDLMSKSVPNPLINLTRTLFGSRPRAGHQQGGLLALSSFLSTPTDAALTLDAEEGSHTPRGAPGAPSQDGGHAYPEWDFECRRHRQRWCTVAEYDPAPGQPQRMRLPSADGALIRSLSQLNSGYQRRLRQESGETVDLTALVDTVIDQAAGYSPDMRVYEARSRGAQGLSVLVLIDSTSSTSEPTAQQRRFDGQVNIGAQLIAALTDLGVRVASYGFYSRGRHNIRFIKVKEFAAPYDAAARQRLEALTPQGFTRLGTAIRHGSWMLTNRGGTPKRLLIVLSDGLPYDTDYEGRYAESDCHHALDEAVAAGIGCALIDHGPTNDVDVITRVWEGLPRCTLTALSELPQNAGSLFAEALMLGAAGQRSRPAGPGTSTRDVAGLRRSASSTSILLGDGLVHGREHRTVLPRHRQ